MPSQRYVTTGFVSILTIQMYKLNLNDYTRVQSDKLVIDTDGGADDAMAILLTLSVFTNNNTNIDIVAITCTYGNTNLSSVEKNVLKTLTIANESKVTIIQCWE